MRMWKHFGNVKITVEIQGNSEMNNEHVNSIMKVFSFSLMTSSKAAIRYGNSGYLLGHRESYFGVILLK